MAGLNVLRLNQASLELIKFRPETGSACAQEQVRLIDTRIRLPV